MRSRPRATLSSIASLLVVGGLVLGISNTAVTPPITAASEPDCKSSLCSRPGSRKCTCVSMTPGSTVRPETSRRALASASAKSPIAAKRSSLMAISPSCVPSGPAMVPPEIIRSYFSVVITYSLFQLIAEPSASVFCFASACAVLSTGGKCRPT